MDLEEWVVNLLKSIEIASDIDAGFEISLDKDAVKAIASAYEKTEWFEIY